MRSISHHVLPMLLWLLSVIPAMEPGCPCPALLHRMVGVGFSDPARMGAGVLPFDRDESAAARAIDPGTSEGGQCPVLTIGLALESLPNKVFRPLKRTPRPWLGVLNSSRLLELVGNDPVTRLRPALRKRRSSLAVDDVPRFARIKVLCRLTC